MLTNKALSGPEKTAALLGGATAGLCVDCTIHPLDTIKTRIQSSFGASFRPSSNGQLRLFAGLPAVLLGSAPAAALFFYTYETVKITTLGPETPLWVASMISACCADIVAYTIRVPIETIKQRAQSQPHLRIINIASATIKDEGLLGLYRGYRSQLSRGLPFCLIQYPVWEMTKRCIEEHNRLQIADSVDQTIAYDGALTKMQFAFCGAFSGAIGGSLTTPMDVAKTRIMLAKKDSLLASGNVRTALKLIYSENGIPGLFSGLGPRVCIMSFGGAIFLGLYDITKRAWLTTLSRPTQ